jgi:hypothetical protein
MGRQAEQAADYLRRADGELLRQDVERLARRQPALVLGSAFVAGLIGARFLKSSERRRAEQDREPGWNERGFGTQAIVGEGYSPGVNRPIGGIDAGS